MRLHKHEELVEVMVEAARRHDGLRNSIRAALDALLDAAVRLGVAELRCSALEVNYNDTLILRLEERTDDA